MFISSAVVLSKIWLSVGPSIGFIGTVLLAASGKVGVVSKGGEVIFNGLDPMDPVEENLKRVKASHWRNRYFAPLGWCMLAVSFLIQLAATWL